MSIKIIILAFEKAEKKLGSSKKTHRAQHISDYLLEEYKYPISERTLRDYYTNALTNQEGLEELKPKVLTYLCNYLGYTDYADFITKNQTEKDVKQEITSNSRQTQAKDFAKESGKGFNPKILMYLGLVFVVLVLITIIIDKKVVNANPNVNCMTWADSLYVAVPCTTGPYSAFGTKVEPMDIMKLKKMKQVKVRLSYPFFNEQNEPLIWYFKNKEGEIEYFTSPGLHPTNGETLRKITPHIIETYVPKHINKKSSFVSE
ncbi:hypothetical protein ACOCEA_02460 [Maribacter sp. CXY002]|uniref:hypothetical protein n=1 Tax=Maribacter luteocoastalis TaxID=3407671 RepID=UPI003B672AC6